MAYKFSGCVQEFDMGIRNDRIVKNHISKHLLGYQIQIKTRLKKILGNIFQCEILCMQL